mmetsp:Transcript_70835/g.153845  ORF Transcript_70835/g.153845 Transcript_70835/m.153845 type:complete len:658 (-) Transcript_70835:47-2020(-)
MAYLYSRHMALVILALAAGCQAVPDHGKGGALREEQHEAFLPPLHEMMGGPREAMAAATSKVEALANQLNQLKEEESTEVTNMRAEYSRRLRQQQREIDAKVASNSKVSMEIEELKHSNAGTRRHAVELQTSNKALTAQLNKLQSDISNAQEFAAESLNKADDREAGELSILKQLADKEAEQKAVEAKAASLNRIAAAGRVSALQMKMDGNATEDLLQSLHSGLAAFRQAGNQTLTALQQSFEEQHTAGELRKAELLKEEQGLNETKNAELVLQKRLNDAVSHLEETNSYLTHRRESLLAFVRGFGETEAVEGKNAPVLLQLGKEVEKNSSAEASPNSIFEALSSQTKDIEKHLQETHKSNMEEAAKQQADFNRRLSEQVKESESQEKENQKLGSEIEDLKSSNAELRARSEILQQQCSLSRDRLKTLQQNMSSALEFVRGSVKSLDDSEAPELSILSELKQQQSERDAAEEKARRLAEVAAQHLKTQSHEKISLLSTFGSEAPKVQGEAASKAILESLAGGFESMAAAQKERLAAMEAHFSAEFEAGKQHQKALMKTHEELVAAKDALTQLKQRLTEAVKHLEETSKELQNRIEGLQTYLNKVGERPDQSADKTAALKAKKSANFLGTVEESSEQVKSSSEPQGPVSWLMNLVTGR